MGFWPIRRQRQQLVPARGPRRWAWGGAAVAIAVPLALGILDRGLAAAYRQSRSSLQERYGKALGRPLRFGDYQGLGPTGLRLGPSRILAGGQDNSHLEASRLHVSVDLLASLLQRRWVITFQLEDLVANWHRNADGRFWVMAGGGKGPLPVELRLHTRQPARFRVWTRAGDRLPQQPDIAATFSGMVAFGHAKHGLEIRGRLEMPEGGWLFITSRGVPFAMDGQTALAARKMSLDRLQPLLAGSPWQNLSGRLNGSLAFGRSRRTNWCRGAMVLRDGLATVAVAGVERELQVSPLHLRCNGRQLQLPAGEFRSGDLAGTMRGVLNQEQELDLDITLAGQLPPWVGTTGGQLESTLRLTGPLAALESNLQLEVTGWQRAATPDAAALPLPPLRLQARSRWQAGSEAGPQLWGDLDAEVGSSSVAINGQLAPAMNLQTSGFALHPGEWLRPAEHSLLAASPYSGLLKLDRSAADANWQAELRLHNPGLNEDLSLRLTSDTAQLQGVLEVGAGQGLELDGQMQNGQWQLSGALRGLDASTLLPPGLLHRHQAAARSAHAAPQLHVEATANGSFGAGDQNPGGPVAPFLRLDGATLDATLSGEITTAHGPLLGPAHLQLNAAGEQLTLDLESPQLRSRGTLRGWPERPLQDVDLDLAVTLLPVSLAHLAPMGRLSLGGALGFAGHVGGTMAAPQLDGEVSLSHPQLAMPLGAITSHTHWTGDIQWQPAGHQLSLAAAASRIQASFADQPGVWAPEWLTLSSGDGTFALNRTEGGYGWTAAQMPLEPLRLVAHSNGNQQWLRGRLAGSGQLRPDNRFLEARVVISEPRLGVIDGQQLALEWRQDAQRLHGHGHFAVDATGQLDWHLHQRGKEPWHLQVALQRIGLRRLRQVQQQVARFGSQAPVKQGEAEDLGGIMSIGTLASHLEAPLVTLQSALARLAQLEPHNPGEASTWSDFNSLEGMVDGDLKLSGHSTAAMEMTLAVDAHLWQSGHGVDHAFTAAPLQIRVEGPLHGTGTGTFRFSRLPLALLGLLSAMSGVPMRGTVAGQGTFQNLLSAQRSATLALELQDVQVHGRHLTLERGDLGLERSVLALDVALQDAACDAPLVVRGTVPLVGSEEDLNVRITTRDEGMLFLTAFSDGRVVWDQGKARFRLWLRGRPEQPEANGFLRLEDGQGSIADIPVSALNASIIFDFENLFVKRLTALVGKGGGMLTAEGYIGLLDPVSTRSPLALRLETVAINRPLAQAQIDGELTLGGSIQSLELEGRLQLSGGEIRLATGNSRSKATAAAVKATPDEGAAALANWTFEEPLDLANPRGRSQLDRSIRAAVPRLSSVSLNGLKLDLGPDLDLTQPRLARFTIAGRLNLNGPMGPDLKPVGVVKLRNGRVGLFTSRFDLDPGSRNVAIFTPSHGLVPYLSIGMSTREVNTARAQGQALGEAAADDLLGNTTAFDQLNLVKIQVLVEGRADQFPHNIELQSVPPLPEQDLIGLIGGNAIGQLTGGGNTTATVFSALGQPLIDPLLNTVSNHLSDRFTFAVYPVTLYSRSEGASDRDSLRLIPEFVLATEVGLSITDRLNVAVIGAPNRRDLEPEVNLNLKLGPSLTVQTNIDAGRNWKSLLQVVTRF